MKNIHSRITKLRKKFIELEIDAYFVSSSVNVRYLSGFTGDDSYLLITYNDIYFITDPRYEKQAEDELPKDFKRVIFFREREKRLIDFLKAKHIGSLGIEEKRLTYYNYEKLKEADVAKYIKGTGGIIEKFRMIKAEEEIKLIKNAIDVSLKAMDEVIKNVRPGMKEKEVSAKFSYLLRLYGAEKESFDTIVGSGPRGALPHGVAGDRVISKDDMVVIDFGVKKDGYNSDTTRTVKLGSFTSLEMEIYNIVKEAQEHAVLAVKPGIKAKDLDKVARDYIMSKGYGSFFGHGLGHGVGLEIHEGPYISPTSEENLLPGMVITIEPGIYLPGKFGVRIEDMVLVTEDGGEVLTHMNKELYYK